MISKYDTSVWPRLVRWLFYTNVDSNVQLKMTATAVIIRKQGWFSRIPFRVLLCAFYNHSDAFFNADDLLTDTTTNKNKPILYYFFVAFHIFLQRRNTILLILILVNDTMSRPYAKFHNDIYSNDWLTNSIWVATLLNGTNDCAT